PLQVLRIEKRRDVRLERFPLDRRRKIRQRRRVVLIRKSRKMMTEFVNENIRRLLAVCGNRAVQAEDSAASVCPGIRDDLDELVRRKGRNVPERSILKSQDIPLRTESVVTCTQRRPAVHTRGRPKTPASPSVGQQPHTFHTTPHP